MAIIGPGAGNYGSQDVYKAPGSTSSWNNYVNTAANYYDKTGQVYSGSPTPVSSSGSGSTGSGTSGGGGAAGSNDRGEKLLGYNANGDPVYGGGGPSQAELEAQLNEQLNASYQPAFNNLADVEAQYRSEYPNSQAFIEQSYAEVLPKINAEEASKEAGLSQQEATAKETSKSQFETARQRYNELRTGGLTRYGGGSSTGEAYNELLGRATQQEMAGLSKNIGDTLNSIAKERTSVDTYYAEKRTNLEKEKQLKLQELKTSFDTEIRKINTQRANLESEKAAKRLAALQEYAAQARQIQYQSSIMQQTLDQWKAYKDETLQLAQSMGVRSFSLPSYNPTTGAIGGVNFGSVGGTGGGSELTPEQLQGLINEYPGIDWTAKTSVGATGEYNQKSANPDDPIGIDFPKSS